MLNNPKFQLFIDHYFTLEDSTEAMNLLKDFMFSLSPDELVSFMLDTGKSHNEAVKQVLNNPLCTDSDKQKLQLQFDSLLNAFARPVSLAKAA